MACNRIVLAGFYDPLAVAEDVDENNLKENSEKNDEENDEESDDDDEMGIRTRRKMTSMASTRTIITRTRRMITRTRTTITRTRFLIMMAKMPCSTGICSRSYRACLVPRMNVLRAW